MNIPPCLLGHGLSGRRAMPRAKRVTKVYELYRLHVNSNWIAELFHNMNEPIITELLHLFNKKAPLARYFGMTLSFTQDGNAQISLPYNPNLNHAMGGIHGGVYATMMDNAGWFTVAANLDKLCWVATSDLSIRFLHPVKQTPLRADGSLLKKGKRLNITEMFLYDSKERLVGHATGSFIVLKNIPLEN
jgi:uncharacterized protein (TIGR00369 family)